MKTQWTRTTQTKTRWHLFLLLLFAGLSGTAFGQEVTNCECWDAVTNWRGTFNVTINFSGTDNTPLWTETWHVNDSAQGSFEIDWSANTAAALTGSASVSEESSVATSSCTAKTVTTGSGPGDPQSNVSLG